MTFASRTRIPGSSSQVQSSDLEERDSELLEMHEDVAFGPFLTVFDSFGCQEVVVKGPKDFTFTILGHRKGAEKRCFRRDPLLLGSEADECDREA